MKAQKPSGTLKKFLDIKDKNTRVIGSLERYVLSKPVSSSRASNIIHPSEMAKADWCHKAEYYELLGKTPAPSKYKASLRTLLIFDEGHRIHERYQRWFGEMGKLYGIWECSICKNKAWCLGNIPCGSCPGTLDTYKEVKLHYEPLRIGGHADGWLVGFGNPLLLEIKSIGEGSVRFENAELYKKHDGDIKKIWKDLDAPFYAHILQVQIYMKLMELLELPDAPQEAVFIYESKATQEIKEFIISKDDFGVSKLFEDAAMIVAAVDSGIPPVCNINPISGCYKCNYHEGEENVDEIRS